MIQQLSYIVNATPEESPYPVGVLSAEGRNKWAQTYKSLKRNWRNRQNIDKIEKSICLVCLDHAVEYDEGDGTGYEVAKSSAAIHQVRETGFSISKNIFLKPRQVWLKIW